MRSFLLALGLFSLTHVGAAAEAPARTTYVTWVMIWNGSTEKSWWNPGDYHGCKVLVDGRWQSINWNDEAHIRTYFEAIRAAGIAVIVVDFTNALRWTWQAQYLQQLCAEHNMQFVVAFNPQAGKEMEAGASYVWKNFAGPDAPAANAYLHRDRKPLLVLYTWRSGYAASIKVDGEFSRKFATAWASGEDSEKDKWGWQVEPHVGPVASGDSMFVTGSLKFGGVKADDDRWRRHLAWLDYGFLIARCSAPRFCIVGSFDDVHERNAWMVADTAAAKRGWQARDIAGAPSSDAFYRRVRDWLLQGKPSVIRGGLLRDGAYRLMATDGQVLGVKDNATALSPAVLAPDADELENYIWFYHLGNNEYRLVKLNAGLSFEENAGVLRSNWDSEALSQRWLAQRSGGGVAFINKATDHALDCDDGNVVVRARDPARPSQTWRVLEAALLP